MEGWIKLHRQLKDSVVYKDSKMLHVWIHILLRASHSYHSLDSTTGKALDLFPGQVVFGRNAWSRELGMSPGIIYRIIKKLEGLGMISISSTNKYSIITVKKWSEYQGYEQQADSSKEAKSKDSEAVIEQQNEQQAYILSADQEKFMNVLKSIENYPFDMKKDLDMYEKLYQKYDKLDILEAIEDFSIYKMENPLKSNSNARSQINTSFKNYTKWEKCLKKNGDGQAVNAEIIKRKENWF